MIEITRTMIKRKNLAIIILSIIIFISAGLWYKNRPITVEVQLTHKQRQEYEAKLLEFTEKLQTEIDPKDPLKRPNLDHFIEKARYEEYLGRLSDSEKTLQKALSLYPISSVAWNNLAKVYERMGKYKKAIKYYILLISELRMTQYFMEIARVAREIGDYQLSYDAYWSYQKIHFNPDVGFENWLREQREH